MPFPVHIGIDDIATGTRMCDGWTYFCLPDVYIGDFAQEARNIIKSPGLHGFHGKRYKDQFQDEYREFLKLIHKYGDMSLQTRNSCILFTQEHKQQLLDSGISILSATLTQSDVRPETAVKHLFPYVPPLLSLARLLPDLGPNMTMSVEMDDCGQANDMEQYIQRADGNTVTGRDLLNKMYNEYVAERAFTSPSLSSNGVAVMSDTKAFLIQAADVFGNFSMAYTFVRLGNESKSRKAKAALIQEVFGDRISEVDFSKQVSFVGNDLVLNDGQESIIYRLGWAVTNK